MNATCRQVSAPRPTELSYDMPVSARPSSGTWFHSLHATSQALQPMHTDVSVKNPIRGCWPGYVSIPSGRVVICTSIAVMAPFPSAR